MGKMIRRDVTAVEARRVPPTPPAAPPDPPPPGVYVTIPPAAAPADTRPNVTQNFFNVSMPPGAPAPPPAAPPTEIHHHHTTVNYTRPAAPLLGLSFFGTAGLVLGGLACAEVYLPHGVAFAHPLALAGLVAAAVGLLSAVLVGRTGRGVPVLALLVSAAGYALALAAAGRLAPAIRQINATLPAAIPRIQIDASNGHLDISLKDQPAPPAGRPVHPAPPSVSNVPSPAASPATPTAKPTAPDEVEAARLAAAKRMGLAYASAKADADRAASDLRAAREVDSPGSPELIAASQAAMNANAALAAMREKLDADPTVSEAKRAAGQ